MKKLLEGGLERLGIEYEEEILSRLLLYCDEINLWNKNAGLVNASGEKLIINHILDSLSGVPLLREAEFCTAADAGSGAGLPGIPLSLFFPDKSFTLVERSGNRAGFLRNCKALMKLDNVRVMESGIESVKEKFDLITFRAFRDFNEYYKCLIGKINEDGYLFAYKGKKSGILNELEKSGVEFYDIRKVTVPYLDEERHIVIIRKN